MAAKAALRRSGYRGQPIPLSYAADLPIQGIPASALAVAVRSQLAEVGIKVQLNPAPAAQALAAYRAGRSAFSLWSWSPDYPDPENYLAFAPGELSAPAPAGPAGPTARSTTSPTPRATPSVTTGRGRMPRGSSR